MTGATVFQSTHSRGVRLAAAALVAAAAIISIHALTRSATAIPTAAQTAENISIHALTRSATLQKTTDNNDMLFQSTHSRGVRLGEIVSAPRYDAISIHALTRSATLMNMCTPSPF